MGQVTQELERGFAQLIGVKHALAVTNGTAALHLAFAALGLGPGDEVICPSLSFVAAANSVVYTGARPVFADAVSLDDLSISPADIEAKITSRTRAIEVMHYAGYACDMEAISSLAESHGLEVVEDCAHAPGAAHNGRACGSLGRVGCFSFFSNKNMTTGEGGMVTTDDDDLAEKIRLMRSHGMTTLTLDRHQGHAFTYDVIAPGYNYRLDEIRAAIGLAQLGKLLRSNERRGELIQRYWRRLDGLDGVILPFKSKKPGSSYHIMPIVLAPDLDRAEFMPYMKSRGIQTSIHYPPIHTFEYYSRQFDGQRDSLPVTEAAGQREVTLPLYPNLDEGAVDYICQVVADFVSEARKGR